MKLRIGTVILSVFMLFSLTACTGKDDKVDISSEAGSAAEQISSATTPSGINPLTGLNNLSPSAANNRPVAVMVNNIKTAQSVQTGLNSADIVYETYVEGGITRLMAVFKDISKASRIGTIRSARYTYVDLAMGHDAVYVHAGEDPTFCARHIAEVGIDDFNLLDGPQSKYSFRVKNGKASEHTLYTDGKTLVDGFSKLKQRTALKKDSGMWQKFLDEKAPQVPGDGACLKAVINMSADYVSGFEYDSAAAVYKRTQNGAASKDYVTGKQFVFKNILVLKTTVSALSSDGYLVKSALDGGEGYYISQGGYKNIKWSKGSASSPIKITLADGTACPMNAGNIWVSLVDKTHAVTLS